MLETCGATEGDTTTATLGTGKPEGVGETEPFKGMAGAEIVEFVLNTGDTRTTLEFGVRLASGELVTPGLVISDDPWDDV